MSEVVLTEPKEFACKVCGKQCDSAPPLPELPVCPEHCEAHEYVYVKSERSHICEHCGQEAPMDWYDDFFVDD